MTLERLYTPWRLAYVTGAAKSSDCVFCTAQQTSDADALIVLTNGGKLSKALGVHGLTATLLVAAGLVLALA